jgi:hypothetical protein
VDGRRTGKPGGVAQQHRRAGLRQHHPHPLVRRTKIQWYVGGTRLDDGEHGDDEVGRALGEQADPVVRADAGGHQSRRQCPRAPVELAVTELGVAKLHGDRVRSGRDDAGEGAADGSSRARGGVHRGRRCQREGGQRPVHAVHELVEQERGLVGQSLGGGRVEQGRVEEEVQPQPVGQVGHQRQRVVGAVGGVDLAHLGPVPGGAGERIVLEHDDAVEQGPAGRHLAGGLDLRQRHEVEPPPLGLRQLQRAQPGPDRQVDAGVHSRRYGVDEHAEHRVHAGQLGRTARHGGAEDHVRLAAEHRQQQRPGALHERVHGQPVPGGGVLHPGRGQLTPDDGGRLGAVRLHRRPVVR